MGNWIFSKPKKSHSFQDLDGKREKGRITQAF